MDSLRLGQNLISELGPNVFKALRRMSSLDLESNRITRIDKKAFVGLEGEKDSSYSLVPFTLI